MPKNYKLVVAGCRDFHDYSVASSEIHKHIQTLDAEYSVIIVSGCAEGADKLGERYASEHNLTVERFPAEWDTYGKYAGPRRNAQMAQVADAVLVFWDGKSKGTKNMIENAKKANKPYTVISI
ncbi:MAG: DUF2493 domain-containing protein [Oscillospiraceae bacterium]|nr:DUF2493 domain-containing protein [Clostridia bacterium]MBP3698176.1 DUF2493 domain-containing protein [Oscillospiraceae bacterium]